MAKELTPVSVMPESIVSPVANDDLAAEVVEAALQGLLNRTQWLNDNLIAAPDATDAVKGVVQLTDDLGGTAENPLVVGLHGAPVPVAGDVGEVLQVTAEGELGYGLVPEGSVSVAGADEGDVLQVSSGASKWAPFAPGSFADASIPYNKIQPAGTPYWVLVTDGFGALNWVKPSRQYMALSGAVAISQLYQSTPGVACVISCDPIGVVTAAQLTNAMVSTSCNMAVSKLAKGAGSTYTALLSDGTSNGFAQITSAYLSPTAGVLPTQLSDAGGAGLVPVSGATPATHAWGDHGALAGRGDDDHTIYVLADCTRAFAGNPVPDADGTRTNGTTAVRWATVFSDAFVGDTVSLGATPALTGDVRLGGLWSIKRRSLDNDSDYNVMSFGGTGSISFGSFTSSASETDSRIWFQSKSGLVFAVGGITTGIRVGSTYFESITDGGLTLGRTINRWAQVYMSRTFVSTGTTGAATANTVEGSVNFAAGASTLVVTNSTVSTSSLIFVQVATVDTTAKTAVVVAAAGSFTITLNAAATAETRVHFKVCN